MNFAYLYINEYENEQDKIDFFEQLKKSIELLKRHTLNPIIYIYHSSNDDEIKEYCISNECISKPISYHRPFTGLIKILVEKIFILKDFSEDEDVVLLDVDTAFKTYVDDSVWGSVPILWSAEYYITQFRNLNEILPFLPWYEVDINFSDSYIMYNTGVVYIPKSERKEICKKALWITDRLNDWDEDLRYGNKLDEQIGLSVAICDRYLFKESIFISNQIIDHFWESKANGEKWWKQIS